MLLLPLGEPPARVVATGATSAREGAESVICEEMVRMVVVWCRERKKTKGVGGEEDWEIEEGTY